jgi:hypothetical protein
MNVGSSVNTNPGVNARSHADPGLNANSGGTGTLNKPERPLRDVWHGGTPLAALLSGTYESRGAP